MKPSHEQGVLAILDTLPECKVVLDALEDPSIPKDPGVAEEFTDSTGMRFRQQTQYEPRPPHASAYVELAWKEEPEFKVEVHDVAFVKQAARRILGQRRLSDRAFNWVTRRTKAARTILNTLDLVY